MLILNNLIANFGKAKYLVTGPYYMECPNPTDPELLIL